MLARRQLRELGLTAAAIEHWVARGRLMRVHQGVYAVGHRRLVPDGWRMAAVLACGPGAVLSHQDAAALWGIWRGGGSAFHVTAPGRSRHGLPGIRVHRVRRLDPRDVTTRDGIPVTALARTLLDLAETAPRHRLVRAIEDAERLQILDAKAIGDVTSRAHGRKGLRSLKAAVREVLGPPEPTRSDFERDFIDFCLARGLPVPAMNVAVLGYEVDALWADARLIVELDSRAFHLNGSAFETDRERDAELQLAGYRVLRVTYRMLHERPGEVERRIRRGLATAPATS